MIASSGVSRVVLAVALVGCMSLAACGSDSGSDDTGTPSAGGNAGTGTSGAAGTAGQGGSSSPTKGGAGGASGQAGKAGASGKGGAGVGGAAGSASGAAGTGGMGGATGGSGGGGSPKGGSGGKGGQAGTGTAGSASGAAGVGGAAAGGSSSGGTGGATGSSVPSKPIAFMKGKPFTIDSGTTNWVYVPASYDDTHKTPTTLLVWLHGCGGLSSGDIWTVSPGGSQSWISLAVGGQEGNCWDMSKDPARVLAALADIKTHFNIKPKGVVLGGYSSGGDLTYRTAFYNAQLFAGVIVENSSPYRDTGSKEAASLAAAAWKFNAVHLAHLQDTTYPIDGVRTETDSMKAAGFPMTRIEVDGGHYDDPGAIENGKPVPGTNADLLKYLLPNLDKGWAAP